MKKLLVFLTVLTVILSFSLTGSAFIADLNINDINSAESKDEAVHHIEEALTGYIKENEWKMGAIMNTLRLFFVGEAKGLGIADIIYFIGKAEALARIERALKTLNM